MSEKHAKGLKSKMILDGTNITTKKKKLLRLEKAEKEIQFIVRAVVDIEKNYSWKNELVIF